MSFPIANYSSHQQSLVMLLDASCGRPLLFIRGDKDFGKTWLLKWFRAEVGARYTVIPFDLAAQQELLSPSLILRKCSDALGSNHFSNFETEVQVYKRSRNAVIQNVEVKGDHNVVNAAIGETLQDQLLVAMDLTKIFIADLKKLASLQQPIVFMFDHYDRASQLISGWLAESLIPALRDVPNSRLVLAGRETPPVDDVWWASATDIVTLTGVNDAKAWSALVKLLKKGFPVAAGADPDVFLQGAIQFSKGVPGALMPFIQTFPPETANG
jgi:hypothetical protein